MCGINLIVDRTGKVNQASLASMMAGTRHRGPDSSRMELIRNEHYQILFGVNRLCIIDENPASDQPFRTGEDHFFLLFNGEVYNQAELRNDLIANGIRFSTFSDTEVLYQFLKSNPVSDYFGIHGMFAYIFIDADAGHLLIGRDPWGMKPLYYYQDERYLVVSSEISGILASGLVPKSLNTEQIPNYLRYRFTAPTYTLLKNIRSFPKGTVYRFGMADFDLQKEIESQPDRTIDREPEAWGKEGYDDNRILSDVEEMLVDSLILHTRSVRPPGLFLSGGVDSTLLLALAARHGIPLPHVFSIVNKGKDRIYGTEDDKYVRLAVKNYQPTAHIIEIDQSIMDEVENFIGMIDHPVADPAFFLTQKLSTHASQVTNVVLSGAGADELFAGYNRHLAFYYYLKHYSRFEFFLPFLKNMVAHLPTGKRYAGRKKVVLLKKLVEKLSGDVWLTFDNFMSLDRLCPFLKTENWDPEYWRISLNSAFERDRQEYLPQDILTVSDKACMLSGLEMRMPYLDEKLSAYMRTLSPERLFSGGRKWILRKLLKKYDGEQFADRPKEGFGFPFGQWIRKPEYMHFLDRLKDEDNPVFRYTDPGKIAGLVQNHLSGREDYSTEIWSLIMLVTWIDLNFR